jgi:hypothetical protein
LEDFLRLDLELPARHAEHDGYVAITLRVMSPSPAGLFELPLGMKLTV